MKTFTIKITQHGMAPSSMTVIAHSSCEALRSALATLSAPGKITVRPT